MSIVTKITRFCDVRGFALFSAVTLGETISVRKNISSALKIFEGVKLNDSIAALWFLRKTLAANLVELIAR